MKLNETDLITEFNLQPTEEKIHRRAIQRYKRKLAIKRKMNIINNVYHWDEDQYKFRGQFSKGKVHCSCIMCQCKVKNEGWTIRDKKQFLRQNDMDENIEESINEEELN